MNQKITLIYNTCDKYECLWKGFFTLLKRYWEGVEKYTIILNTEQKEFSFGDLKIRRPKKVSKDVSWSQRILNSLQCVETPYVLMMLDDFYLKAPVNCKALSKDVLRMEKENNIKTITYAWQPGPNKSDVGNALYERRGRFAPYRVNAQIALWRVEYLKDILRSYENPWQFEISGSFRSSLKRGTLLSLKKDSPKVFSYDYGFLIIRGKVNRKLLNYFQKIENLQLEFPFEDYVETKTSNFKQKGRTFRLMNYAMEMFISLFKK